jgi:hypothetical protein
MRSLVSGIEYYLLAAFQAAMVVLIMAAWIVWQIAWRFSWIVFEILLGYLFWLCRWGTCRSTATLLRRLPPDFGVTEWGNNDAD